MKAPVDVAEVKPFEMVISTTPAVVLAGAVTVNSISLIGDTPTALEPNLTEVTDFKLVPAIVTDVPPEALPVFGVTEVMVGAGGVV